MRLRVTLGLLVTGLLLGLWGLAAEAPGINRSSIEAPLTLQGSSPEFRSATEREEQICMENSMRGDGPSTGDCRQVPTGTIYEDDPWGRWNCATMGNRICGPRYLALTG